MILGKTTSLPKAFFFMIVVLVSILLPACKADSKNNTNTNEIVVFYANTSGNTDIYSIDLFTDQTVQLTDHPSYDDSPAVSPDGSTILFLSARNDLSPHFPDLKYDIFIMDITGGNLRQLTNSPQAEDHPAWSPEGSQILFDADYDDDDFYELYKMNADGSGLIRLTKNQANDQFADWSPDGTRIAFSSDRNGNWDIYIMDADGSNQQQITGSTDWELFPAWSPDGTYIAYTFLVPRSRNTEVFVMTAFGKNAQQLTDAPGFDENPVWTADGEQILYQSNQDGNFNIYCMDKDGKNQHAITQSSADELWPSLSKSIQ